MNKKLKFVKTTWAFACLRSTVKVEWCRQHHSRAFKSKFSDHSFRLQKSMIPYPRPNILISIPYSRFQRPEIMDLKSVKFNKTYGFPGGKRNKDHVSMIGTWSPGFWWGTIRPGFLRLAINDGLPVTQKTATHHWDRHIFNLTFPRSRLCGENLPLVEESIANTATLGGPIFPTFPYKTWRTVHMRTKTLAQIEGWPAG